MATISNREQKLSPKQVAAIAALLIARDVKSAAATVGVGERTLHTWLGDPLFKAALRDAEGEAIDGAVRRLAGTAGHALDVLLRIMLDKAAADGVRVRAAVAVLEQLVKLREVNSLEERIAALERAEREHGSI